MERRIYQVLFLCTGNSARSILAECLLNRLGEGRFVAHSAGSQPKSQPHPQALALLERLHYDTGGLRSKSWDEFAAPHGPHLDFVFTVCDNARGESCPIWPGRPITAHWGSEDPAAAAGSEEARMRVFQRVYTELESRIRLLVSLPLESLDRLRVESELEAIGRSSPAPSGGDAR